MQANRNILYAREKHPFASYPAAKHPNAANLGLQTYDINQQTFLKRATGIGFSFRNIVVSLGSCRIYNSLVQMIIWNRSNEV